VRADDGLRDTLDVLGGDGVEAFLNLSRLDRLAFRRTGEPPYGLEVCASCRHYLKSVDVPVSGYLAIERALSAPLDSGARAAGLVG